MYFVRHVCAANKFYFIEFNAKIKQKERENGERYRLTTQSNERFETASIGTVAHELTLIMAPFETDV